MEDAHRTRSVSQPVLQNCGLRYSLLGCRKKRAQREWVDRGEREGWVVMCFGRRCLRGVAGARGWNLDGVWSELCQHIVHKSEVLGGLKVGCIGVAHRP